MQGPVVSEPEPANPRTLRGVVGEFLDALYPPRCALCGAPAGARSEGRGDRCGRHELPQCLVGPRCSCCAVRLADVLPDGTRCAACRRDKPPVERIVALGDWAEEPALQTWLLRLKYGGRRDLAAPLARALAERLALLRVVALPALVVPVPLHPWRRLERGYDQAFELARELALELGVPCRRALARVRATSPQGTPGAVSRAANVRGAFRFRSRFAAEVRAAQVWIVDDVVTSGATSAECARVLRRAGAVRIAVACWARAGAKS